MNAKIISIFLILLMLICSFSTIGIGIATKNKIDINKKISVREICEDFIPNKIIINFYSEIEQTTLKSSDVTTIDACKIKEFIGFNVVNTIPSLNSVVIKVNAQTREELNGFIDDIEKDPRVKYAESNYLSYTCVDPPNDPFWDYESDSSWSQWGPQRINCLDGWDSATGEGVTIAIIDTGVDCNHVDLVDKIVSPYDVVDVDLDDYSYEYDFWNDTGDCWYDDYFDEDTEPDDTDGHGTHCAGIAAATTNNEIGIAGVACDANIMPVRAGFSVKCYSEFVGLFEDDDITNAIIYATDAGADVISMSLGCARESWEISESIRDACQRAWDNGVILVAASGNENDDSCDDYYPSAFDTVISVGAINKNDDRCGFSNYGGNRDDGTGLELMAPGESITSTYPDDYIARLDGTSMACPHVAGVAALAIDKHPDMSNSQIRQLLRDSAEDIASGSDPYNEYGFGLASTVFIEPDNSPGMPKITGTRSGNTGEEYEYTFTSNHPLGEQVKYRIDWNGDGQIDEETGFHPSAEGVTRSHTWNTDGGYTIKAKAKDGNDRESEWGTLTVSMPKNKFANTPFLNIAQRNPRLLNFIQGIMFFKERGLVLT